LNIEFIKTRKVGSEVGSGDDGDVFSEEDDSDSNTESEFFNKKILCENFTLF